MKRSILKKMIVLTLAFAMVFSSVITAVSANTAELSATFTATADKASYVAGDTVVVTVAANGDAADAIGLDFTYDEALTLVSAEWAVEAAIADVDGNRAALAFNAPVALAGDLFVITLTVNAEVADGTYNVTVTPVAKNGAVVLATEAAVAEVVVGNAHECEFGDWQKDETSHWKECDCGEVVGLEDHAYANNCDDTCDTCGYVRTVGDHEWGEWIIDTAATDKAAGSKHRECSCGEREDKIIPMMLKMNSVSLTLDSSIAVNFKTNKSFETIDGYTDLYAVIIKNGKETVIPMDPENFEKGTGVNQLGRYMFTYKLNPQSVNDKLEVYLYGTYEGELYVSNVLEYNITEKYIYTQLRKAGTSNAWKTLYTSLLNYASACQIKQNYNAENLANAGLTDAEKAFAITGERTYTDVQNTAYATIENPTAKFNSVALELADAVVIKFAATIPATANFENVTLKAKAGTTEFVVTSDMFVWDASKSRYNIFFDKLGAHQMSRLVEFTLYDGDTAISNTFSYSVETYVARQLTNLKKSDPKLADVLVKMLNYGDSCVALKNS